MRQIRALSLRALVACGAVVLAIGVAEAALRLLEIQPKLPGVFSARKEEPSATNPTVLHRRVGRVPQDPNYLRICFLGDSFVYGLSVEPNQTLVRQVGPLLAKRWPHPCVAINCGQVAGDVISEWVRLNCVIDVFRPDLVVHVLSCNDLDIDQPHSLTRILKVINRDPSWVSRRLRVAHLVEVRVREAVVRRRYLEYLHGGSTPQLQARAWRMVTHEITATKNLAEQHGSAYVLVKYPGLVLGLHDYPLEEVHRQTDDLALCREPQTRSPLRTSSIQERS